MDDSWRGKNYAHFTHRTCEFFPCHQGVDEDSFNCLFCYCPLYSMGERCGGCFTYTVSGVKSCKDCTIPHRVENYGYIIGKLAEEEGRQSRKT